MANPKIGLPDSSADPNTGRSGSSSYNYSSHHSKGQIESYGRHGPSPAALVALNTLSNSPRTISAMNDSEKYYGPMGLPMDEGMKPGSLSEIRLIGEAK
jgi:hypothetical protein